MIFVAACTHQKLPTISSLSDFTPQGPSSTQFQKLEFRIAISFSSGMSTLSEPSDRRNGAIYHSRQDLSGLMIWRSNLIILLLEFVLWIWWIFECYDYKSLENFFCQEVSGLRFDGYLISGCHISFLGGCERRFVVHFVLWCIVYVSYWRGKGVNWGCNSNCRCICWWCLLVFWILLIIVDMESCRECYEIGWIAAEEISHGFGRFSDPERSLYQVIETSSTLFVKFSLTQLHNMKILPWASSGASIAELMYHLGTSWTSMSTYFWWNMAKAKASAWLARAVSA